MDDAAHFREHGWVALREALPPERAAGLARELDRVFPESRLPADRVHERVGISALSPLLAGQVRDAVVAGRVAAICGWPRAQLLQDTALVKPPRSPARVEWHQDHTYTGYLSECVSVRIALTGCTLRSGCLRVIDRSHRWGFLGELRALRAREVSDDSDQLPEGWREQVVAVELRAGDASVHHCLTFHSSEENRSEAPRMTLIARMFDARFRLQPDKLPPGLRVHFPTDAEGRLTGAAFPLL